MRLSSSSRSRLAMCRGASEPIFFRLCSGPLSNEAQLQKPCQGVQVIACL